MLRTQKTRYTNICWWIRERSQMKTSFGDKGWRQSQCAVKTTQPSFFWCCERVWPVESPAAVFIVRRKMDIVQIFSRVHVWKQLMTSLIFQNLLAPKEHLDQILGGGILDFWVWHWRHESCLVSFFFIQYTNCYNEQIYFSLSIVFIPLTHCFDFWRFCTFSCQQVATLGHGTCENCCQPAFMATL